MPSSLSAHPASEVIAFLAPAEETAQGRDHFDAGLGAYVVVGCEFCATPFQILPEAVTEEIQHVALTMIGEA